MSIATKEFSDKLKLFRISNGNNVSISLLNYGATLQSILIPDRSVPLLVFHKLCYVFLCVRSSIKVKYPRQGSLIFRTFDQGCMLFPL